jgi:alpha-L-rhamnosidase
MARESGFGGFVIVSRLRCEALTDPLAIVDARPRLSWIVESPLRNQVQTAYEILASSTPELLEEHVGDLWATGKIFSDETLNIEYAGQALEPAQRCHWKVRAWDSSDTISDWSAPALFGSGLKHDAWNAEWIGFDAARNLELPPAPFDGAQWIWLSEPDSSGVFIGELVLPNDAVVEDAQVAISVAGRFQFCWGQEYFGKSDNDPEPWKRPLIRRMTERLSAGVNRFLIRAERIGDQPVGLLFKATVRLADGRVITFVSSDSWRATSEVREDWSLATGNENWPSARVVANYGDAPWGILRGDDNFLPPPAHLRGTLEIAKPVRQATLFSTAFGAFDLHLNGERVNSSHFDPGWTDYHKRLYYRAYDVTRVVHSGENVLGAILADGWFSGYIGWYHERDIYGKHPRLRAQLHLEYEDGTTEIIGSSSDWRTSLGPILEADMLMGEVFDARAEMPGWDAPGFDDSSWQAVNTGAILTPMLEPHPTQPVVALEKERFTPREITEPQPGQFVFDLGQNFAGVVRLKLRKTVRGQKIVIRHAERLNADGTLYTRNLRTARATDTYICRGDDTEIWMPRFTFHGFQYVEVTGLNAIPNLETITGIPLSSDTPLAGSFECSDELTNKLASNAYWSQRSNFLEIITDCPQRDERMGWCDAAWTFVGAGAMRADVQTFYNKWTVDLEDAQHPDGQFPWLAPLVVLTAENVGPLWKGASPAWSDAGIICPYSIYERYGDVRQLERHYAAMVRQIDWYVSSSRDDLLPPETFVSLGDWLNHDAPMPHDVFRTVFFAHSTDLVTRSARVLGKLVDALRFEALFSRIKAAFQAYVQPDGRISGDVQGCYAFALEFGLLEPRQEHQALEHLVANIEANGWKPTTGLEATLPMMLSLSRFGRSDVAYRLLHNQAFPGWNFSILNGATTIWERWNSWTPEDGFGDANMNSFNHFSLGAVYQWMVEFIGGIRQEDTGFKQLLIAPEPGGKLSSARASYDSVRGLIETDWQLVNGHLELNVRIPVNTTATIILPTSSLEGVTENGLMLEHCEDLAILKTESNGLHLGVGSGQYQFRIQHPIIAREPLVTARPS